MFLSLQCQKEKKKTTFIFKGHQFILHLLINLILIKFAQTHIAKINIVNQAQFKLQISPVAETVQHGSERCRLFTDLAD